MNIQLTQKQLCEILSRSIGTNGDSVEIVECKEDVKCGDVGEAFPVPHNPDGLTPEQYGATDGYRLLDEDEIKERYDSFYIEKYVKAKPYYWSKNEWSGNEKTYTYRTKLSREELTKLP